MRKSLASLALAALTLTGCVAGSQVSPGDDYKQMRADLKSCALDDGAWAFALIPDFGGTAEFHTVKCMKGRGWIAGPGRSGIHDYARISTDVCPDNYAWNGNGCSEVARLPVATEPAWDTGE